MTRKISTFIFIGLIFTVAMWMSDKASLVMLSWRGYNSELSLPEAMVLVLVFVALVDFINGIVRKVLNLQVREAYRSSYNNVRENEAIDVLAGKISEKIVIDRHDFDKSLLNVLKAMTSVTAGDMKAARENIKALKKIIGNDPIIDVLTMKIYKGEKDFDNMEKLSARLMKNEDIQIVGMKAAVEAQMQKKEFAEALVTANKAFELRQDLYWVIESAFDLRANAGDWDGALQVLDAGIKKKLIPVEKQKRLKAIVLFEMAKEAQAKGDDVNFFRLCSQSISADGTLVAAALEMAKYYVENDNQFRKAVKVLTTAWSKNPTDEIAYAYLALFPKDDILTKIQKMESFALYNGLRPSLNNRILAELCAEAGLWGKAKGEMEIFLINNPCTRKICKLISKYEQYHHKDKATAKAWMDRIDSFAEDSVWVCESCEATSDKWHAVCPVCGAFGQEKWHLYVEASEQDTEIKNVEEDDED